MSIAVNILNAEEGPITSYDILPESKQARDEGVLYISSGPWDSMRLSWMQRQITNNLSQLGYRVLRFDLCGTGDSMELTSAASWERWIRECYIARDALRKSVRKVHVVGFCLGAALALKASESYAFRSLHLIDPVLDGAAYWQHLTKLQAAFLAFQNQYGSHIHAPDELFGFPLGADWKLAFDSLALQQIDIKGRRAYIYSSSPQTSQEAFVAHLLAREWEVKTVPVQDDFAWSDPIKLHLQCFANQTLQSLCHAFAEL